MKITKLNYLLLNFYLMTLIFDKKLIMTAKQIKAKIKLNEKIDKFENVDMKNVNRSFVVKKINSQRSRINSENMNMLYWDKQLERDAFVYASNCMYSAFNKPHSERFKSKIGVALCTYYEKEKFETCVDNWFEEIKMYNEDNNNCTGQYESCFNYKQLMWAEARYVGCSYNYCEFVDNLPRYFYRINLFVCFFAPVTKFLKDRPYRIGERLSKCENHYSNTDSCPLCDIELGCKIKSCDENKSGCMCECFEKELCFVEVDLSRCSDERIKAECYCRCSQLLQQRNKDVLYDTYDPSKLDLSYKVCDEMVQEDEDESNV